VTELSSGRNRALLATASVAVALAAADTYVVVLALEDMMSGVGLGIDALQKATPIISGFLLGYIATLPLIGRLADLVSRQRVLLACLALFVLGSAATALAVEMPVLVAGRVLQGVGGGGLVPATLALVAQLWPVGERGTPLGVVGAVQEIGSVLGPLLGAAILTVWDWRMIFWLNAIAGVVLAVLIKVLGGSEESAEPARVPYPRLWRAATALAALATVALLGLALWAPERLTQDITWGEPFVPYVGHESRLITQIGLWGAIALAITLVLLVPLVWPVLRRTDLVGALLITVALGALVLTFASADPEQQVIGAQGKTLLPVAAIAAGLYLVRHRMAARPLIARGVVRRRVGPSLVASMLVGTALVAVVVDVPILARLTVTDDQTAAALILVRFLLAVPIGALAGGWLLRRTGPGLVAAPGLALAGVGMLVMSTWGRGSLETVWATVILAAVGLGIGLSIAPINDAALADAPESDHGVAAALIVVARMIGMVVGLGLLTAIGLHRFYGTVQALENPTVQQVKDAGVVQVQTVFLGAAIAALVAAVVALALGRARVTHLTPLD
jgi:MFS family permease